MAPAEKLCRFFAACRRRPNRARRGRRFFLDRPRRIYANLGIFQVFRRSSPKPKVAGCYAKLLIVPDNDRAEEMSRRFHDGDPPYHTDAKWWELVQEADRQLLVGGGPGPGTPTAPTPGPADTLDGFAPQSTPAPGNSAFPPAPPVIEVPIASLSGHYRSDSTNLRWNVQAFEVDEAHPALSGSVQPWRLRLLNWRTE
jgi:hypothetical protein